MLNGNRYIIHPLSMFATFFILVFVFPYPHAVSRCQVSALFSEFSISLRSTQRSTVALLTILFTPINVVIEWLIPNNMFSVFPLFGCPFQWNTEENFVYPLAIQIGIQLPTSTVTIPARKIYGDRAWNIIPKIIACGRHFLDRVGIVFLHGGQFL